MYFGVFFENYLINPEKENGFTQPWAEYGPQASVVADRWPNPVGLARRARLRCGHRAVGAGVGVAPAGSQLTTLRQGLNHDDKGTEGVAPGKVEEGGGALTR
jgi:hypothetical protein